MLEGADFGEIGERFYSDGATNEDCEADGSTGEHAWAPNMVPHHVEECDSDGDAGATDGEYPGACLIEGLACSIECGQQFVDG